MNEPIAVILVKYYNEIVCVTLKEITGTSQILFDAVVPKQLSDPTYIWSFRDRLSDELLKQNYSNRFMDYNEHLLLYQLNTKLRTSLPTVVKDCFNNFIEDYTFDFNIFDGQ